MKHCLILLLCLSITMALTACTDTKEDSTDPSVIAETYVGDGFTANLKTLVTVYLSHSAEEDGVQYDFATLTLTVDEKEDDTCSFNGTVERQKENGKTKIHSFKGTADCVDGNWQITEIK